jgi:hypothetical protein
VPDLGNSRRKLKIAIGAMLAADVVAAGILFSPLVGSANSRALEINELRAQLTKKTREVQPLRGMDKIQQARYKEEEAESSGVIPVAIEGSFSGDYLQLVRFINTLERSKLFFSVDSVDLAGESAGPVKLEITMHSYLRSGA